VIPDSRLTVRGGALATSAQPGHFTWNVAAGLTDGRVASGGNPNALAAAHTYFDSSAHEVSAGSSSGWVTAILLAARGYTGALADKITFWVRSTLGMTLDNAGKLTVVSEVAAPVVTASGAGFNGSAAGLTNVPAGQLTGDVDPARLTSVPAASLTGDVDPARLTSVPAASLTGSVDDARLSSNVPLKNAANTFTAKQTVNGEDIEADSVIAITGVRSPAYEAAGDPGVTESVTVVRDGGGTVVISSKAGLVIQLDENP
jgi:hypothetical protein